MRYQTMEQLTELRLSPMRNEYQRQCELPAYQDLTFDDRFAEIVTAQSNNRHEARLKRLVKNRTSKKTVRLLTQPKHFCNYRCIVTRCHREVSMPAALASG